ncbi:MAG: hypothetical protein IJ390_13410 [Lachnospiraceae bacterium]|nr:hypothetical protein [Lachnospiraceae bacterium]
MKKEIRFQFDKSLKIGAEDFSPVLRENGDFWRLHLDYCKPGMNHELGVYAHEQETPEVSARDGKIAIEYPHIIAEDGTVHEIRLKLTVEEEEGALRFFAEMENHSKTRINELQYPLFEFNRIDGDFEDDIFYLPMGLGQKVQNPHAYTLKGHSEYMAADYKDVIRTYAYPGELSMPWIGVKSGGNYLYLGAHSDIMRRMNFVTAAEPRESKEEYLILSASSYPAALPGETVCYDGFCLALFDSDWREGAEYYRSWAEQSWLEPITRKDSVKHLHGWQRIILKHQFGEIFHTYEELPRIYKEGAKYGLTMILLFAWWKEGMDNGYPDNYEPDEALGGAEKLKQAIKEINDLGGTVVLYANGHLMDISSEYYKKEGFRYSLKDIDNNEYQEFYKFSNNGTLLREAHKTFVGGCFATQQWRNQIYKITENNLKYGSNGIFFDQLGIVYHTCFDTSHEHGNRIDEEPQYRIQTIRHIKSMLKEEHLHGTEGINDRAASYMDYLHGCGFATGYEPDGYPLIFRYVFPEIPVTNRFAHDERWDWKKQLNYAFAYGMIYDVSIYRGRAKSIEDVPNYAAYLKELIDLRKEYLDFFTAGKIDAPRSELPEEVRGAEFSFGEETILTLWNNSDKVYVLSYGADAGTCVEPGELKVCRI